MSSPQPAVRAKKDFQSLRASGQAAGITLSIGRTIGRMRDSLAGLLVRLGVTPNGLTIVGFVFSLVGSALLALAAGAALPIDPFAPVGTPRSWLPAVAVAWYFLSAACDMLDGAVARLGNLYSEFGAVLDSSLDRISDTAVWCGCVVYFAGRSNVTYCFLAILALSNAYMISYIKARAEDIIPDCNVGFWQRGADGCGIDRGNHRPRAGLAMAAGNPAASDGSAPPDLYGFVPASHFRRAASASH